MARLPGQIGKQWRGAFPSFCLWMLLLLLPASVRAQQDELPRLMNTAVSENGEVVIFYPDGWRVSSGDSLQLVQPDDNPIEITVRIMPTAGVEAEALPEWIIREFLLSPSTSITPVPYSGVDGWIAQGAFLFEPGIYSAVVVLPISPAQAAVIRIDSPTLDISDDAPLITAILEKLIILPQDAAGANAPLAINLPQTWQLAEATVTLPAEADLTPIVSQTISGDDFTAGIFITAGETSPSETSSQQEVRDFLVNDQPARMQLTADRMTGAGLLTFTRVLENDQILVMRVIGTTPQALVDHLPMLQAIFASITLEN